MRTLLVITTIILMFFGCNNSKNNSAFEKQRQANNHPGKKLMETYCYMCHQTNNNEISNIAPSMVTIKNHYINKNTSKQEFIKAFQSWIKNPNPNNSKMPDAIKKFGIMPKTPYPEEEIELIADYIYSFNLDSH